MADPQLIPVDHDPFASSGNPPPSGVSLVPVDHDPFQSKQTDYTGWDVPGTSTVPGMPGADAAVPFKREPGYYYGSVIPFRIKQDATGKDIPGTQQLAVPEAIAAPARGVIEGGQAALGERSLEDPKVRADIRAASTLGATPTGRPIAGVAESSVRPAAVEARQAGYVLPPASISKSPGIVSRALAGWSGKIKTWQEASAKNQELTNQLAAQTLGLPRDTVLTPEVLSDVRKVAGTAYDDVVRSVPTISADQDFKDLVETLGGQNSHAARAFPKITNNPGIKELVDELGEASEHPTSAWVEVVKELRFNATSNLRAIGDPSRQALGLAQREAANAVDDLMERRIAETGLSEVVDSYRAARKLIAKAHDVETAANSATGDVNARVLARLSDKGRPLTDELRTIANAALAFPKSMQSPSGFGDNETWSALDFFGSAGALAHGNPGVASAILARPIARAALLSNRFQNSMTLPKPPLTEYGVPPVAVGPSMAILSGATNGQGQQTQ